MLDSVLARRLRRTIKEVVEQREARRIGLPTGVRRWSASEIKLLGKMPDTELARRSRRPLWAVRQQRDRLKILAFTPRPRFRFWKPSEINQLGTVPDAQLA